MSTSSASEKRSRVFIFNGKRNKNRSSMVTPLSDNPRPSKTVRFSLPGTVPNQGRLSLPSPETPTPKTIPRSTKSKVACNIPAASPSSAPIPAIPRSPNQSRFRYEADAIMLNHRFDLLAFQNSFRHKFNELETKHGKEKSELKDQIRNGFNLASVEVDPKADLLTVLSQQQEAFQSHQARMKFSLEQMEERQRSEMETFLKSVGGMAELDTTGFRGGPNVPGLSSPLSDMKSVLRPRPTDEEGKLDDLGRLFRWQFETLENLERWNSVNGIEFRFDDDKKRLLEELQMVPMPELNDLSEKDFEHSFKELMDKQNEALRWQHERLSVMWKSLKVQHECLRDDFLTKVKHRMKITLPPSGDMEFPPNNTSNDCLGPSASLAENPQETTTRSEAVSSETTTTSRKRKLEDREGSSSESEGGVDELEEDRAYLRSNTTTSRSQDAKGTESSNSTKNSYYLRSSLGMV